MAPEEASNVADRRREALFAEYGEVVGNFRLLTDIRFKLLALLPLAAAAAAALQASTDERSDAWLAMLGLSAFGLVVTAGLMSYNDRNDQLYGELVGRAAAIERELGLPDGAFAHRPNPWFSLRMGERTWPVNHGRSVAVIYGASVALWLFGVLDFALRVASGAAHTDEWAVAAALAAVALTVVAARSIAAQRKARGKQMRVGAAATARIAHRDLELVAQGELFYALCAGLLNSRIGALRAYRELCDGLANTPKFSQSTNCDVLVRKILWKGGKEPAPRDVGEDVRKRAKFYREQLRVNAELYCDTREGQPALTMPSYLVALITDLSPRWILDCATERRKSVELKGLD